MTPERWRRITEVFHAVLGRDAAARGALLDEACAGDLALRAEVDAMLAAHRDAGRFGEGLALSPSEEAPRLAPGTTLGPYRIERLIGSGAMGEVYRAHDARLDREVAVKVLPAPFASDRRLKQRLEREARALATLSHPHICPIFDVGQQDGVDYLVMEYLEGETLANRLAKGPLPLHQALRCASEIAAALDAAHRQGLVHRDLKPGNVMLTKAGARLLDFGLAKLRPSLTGAGKADTAAAPGSLLTGEGRIVGTLHYMAPEQLNGKEADARTDIFAFGAVAYEMVTGRKAFEANRRPASSRRSWSTSPPPSRSSSRSRRRRWTISSAPVWRRIPIGAGNPPVTSHATWSGSRRNPPSSVAPGAQEHGHAQVGGVRGRWRPRPSREASSSALPSGSLDQRIGPMYGRSVDSITSFPRATGSGTPIGPSWRSPPTAGSSSTTRRAACTCVRWENRRLG